MIEFMKLNHKLIFNKIVPVNKFACQNNHEVLDDILQIKWVTSLRPKEMGLSCFEDDLRLYEEIQILEIDLLSQNNIFDVSHVVMSTLSYPAIIFLKYRNKCRVAMSKLYKNRVDYDKYCVKGIIISSCLFPEERELSTVTQNVVEALDITQYNGLNLYETHQCIYNEICKYQCKSMSRAKTRRVVEFMIGKQSEKVCNSIFANCDVFKFYPSYEKTAYANNNTTNYILAHDWEEVWMSLQKYEPTKKSIQGRGYTSMEELMYRFEEYEMRRY